MRTPCWAIEGRKASSRTARRLSGSGSMRSTAICSTRSVPVVVLAVSVMVVVPSVSGEVGGGCRDALDPRRGGGVGREHVRVERGCGHGPVGGGESPAG